MRSAKNVDIKMRRPKTELSRVPVFRGHRGEGVINQKNLTSVLS